MGGAVGLGGCVLAGWKGNGGAARCYERGWCVPDADTARDEEGHYVILTKGLGRASGGEGEA